MKNKDLVKTKTAHTFFIPVMGIGFTIDTPLKVARYGISSVISLVDDTFIEQMRRYHSEKAGEPYEEISRREEDFRAKRTTAYLDLVDRLVKKQVEELQASPFEPGSEITRYYELLPESDLKSLYEQMMASSDPEEKEGLQEKLRQSAIPGSIDVNIMTKVDRMNYSRGKILPPEYSDTRSALRGYASSTLSSSIVFSAGLNPPLYSYIAHFEDFFPDTTGKLKNRLCSRSATSDLRRFRPNSWPSGGSGYPSTGSNRGSTAEVTPLPPRDTSWVPFWRNSGIRKASWSSKPMISTPGDCQNNIVPMSTVPTMSVSPFQAASVPLRSINSFSGTTMSTRPDGVPPSFSFLK